MAIFKAYDIRGLYPEQLNVELAYNIGRAFVTFLSCDKVVVGRDMRPSGVELFEALARGITDQGADVYDIGIASTPMLYFAGQGYPAAIIITASHNPKEYNGMKLCRENAIPIGELTGIKDIEKLAIAGKFKEPTKKGSIKRKDIMDDFIAYNAKLVKLHKPVKVVLDTANGMGGHEMPIVFKKLGINFSHMYPELDGSFPNHEANPLKLETLESLQKRVVKEKASLGIAIDGDADRCGFVDELGQVVASDVAGALIAKELLKNNPGSLMLADLRSTMAFKEDIEALGGRTGKTKVGHAFIKRQMRDEGALFACELSGHFYYKDMFYTESSILTSLLMMQLIEETGKPLSELVKPIMRYHQSGEINFTVVDKAGKINALKAMHNDCDSMLELDGLSIYYKDWWFNVRASNTEPLLRLNVEAKDKRTMEQMRDKLSKEIGS